MDRISKFKPDVFIHLGDLYEADSASRWPTEYDWDLECEFRSANEMLGTIRKRLPKTTKLVFLPGNHDDNLIALNRLDKKIRGLCDWRRRQYTEADEWLNEELLSHWYKPAQYRADRIVGVYRIGPVTFAHGYECSQSSDEFQSYLYGLPYGLFVSGHTHRPMPVTQARRTKAIPLPYWYANVGCACDMDREYMHRKRQHDWGQAIITGETSDQYRITTDNPGVQWDAEVEIMGMFNDYGKV